MAAARPAPLGGLYATAIGAKKPRATLTDPGGAAGGAQSAARFHRQPGKKGGTAAGGRGPSHAADDGGERPRLPDARMSLGMPPLDTP